LAKVLPDWLYFDLIFSVFHAPVGNFCPWDSIAHKFVSPSGVGTRFAFRFARTDHLPFKRRSILVANPSAKPESPVSFSREELIQLLNEDLAREYQAVIAYVVYSQVLKGAQYMKIAAELQLHAGEELQHALIIAKQIDYLGGMPAVVPKPVKTSAKAEDMLRFDLDNENETIRNYRQRLRQCEALGEFAMAEQIRQILVQEQEHQIDLATALGIEVPDVGRL
jgi:bacterioferritin